MDLRQGPWWTESTLLPTGLAYVHRVHACVAGEGIFPCFLAGVFPLVTCLPASFRSGASAQLTWGKAPPGLGDFVGGVNTACGVPWCADHGGGLPSTTAASVRWLRPR